MKSRKVLTILLSLAIMFTFMPAMAFAQTISGDDAELMLDIVDPDSGSVLDGIVTSVSWADDYHTAKVIAKYDDNTIQKTWNFEYYDIVAGMEATKADYNNEKAKLVVYPAAINDDGTVTYAIGYAMATNESDDYDYEWEIVDELFNDNTVYEKTAVAKSAENKTVYDAYLMTYAIGGNSSAAYDTNDGHEGFTAMTMDAGEYGAWYALKDSSNATRTAWGYFFDLINEVGPFDDVDDGYFSVGYPEYNAYEYASAGVNKELAITVSLNASAIKADFGNDALVSTATKTIKLTPQVAIPDEAYYADYSVTLDAVDHRNDYDFWTDDDGEFWEEFEYDGATHDLTFTNEPAGITKKYFIGTVDSKTGDYTEPKTDSDWTTTFAGLKDAGTYKIYVKYVTDFDGTEYELAPQYVVIDPFEITIGWKQLHLNVEYGKLDATGLEAAIKALVTVESTPDSSDKVQEAIDKYLLLKGLFTDAGDNYIYPDINDNPAFLKDTALQTALSNYYFDESSRMQLTIEKADNDVQLKAVTKSYKAKKKTKKLAAKKTFSLSATADFGTVLYKKVSGNAKITVSSAGKVTVKKGLKKGTYKVKVKAYTKGTANYAAGSDTQTIVVKVK